ncbi:MAG: histidine phosphatase family protein [Steroidobacteraceae bacterium]
MVQQLYLIRHGETAWSQSGQHTGRTDIPLTARGEAQARRAGERLRELQFTAVLTSPLQRARRTCELAGLNAPAQVDEALREWDYGQYEGLTSAEIRQRQRRWDVFRDGCPGGETPPEVSARADGVLERLRQLDGCVAVFSHGHFLRSLAVRWVGLPILHGRNFGLSAGAVCMLGYEHQSLDEPAIELWNAGTGA